MLRHLTFKNVELEAILRYKQFFCFILIHSQMLNLVKKMENIDNHKIKWLH